MLPFYFIYRAQHKIALEDALCAVVALLFAAAEAQQCAQHPIRGKCIRRKALDDAAGQ